MALRIPPLVILAIAGLLVWTLARHVAVLPMALPSGDLAAGLLAALGTVACVLGIVSFRRARTTVDPLHPEQASALVVTGIYRFSRNPMYLGFAIILLAWVVHLSEWSAVIVVAAFVAYMNRFQIAPEERALAAQFGQAFLQYKQSVRRWL